MELPAPRYILVEDALFLWRSFPRCSSHSPCSLVIRKINPCSLSFSFPFFLNFLSTFSVDLFLFYFCFRLYLFSFSYFLFVQCNSFSSFLPSSSLLSFIILLCLSFWVILVTYPSLLSFTHFIFYLSPFPFPLYMSSCISPVLFILFPSFPPLNSAMYYLLRTPNSISFNEIAPS